MNEKEFEKLVDEVTERVTLSILGANWVCYRCGDKSVIERVEKLERKVESRMRIVDKVEVVRCGACHFYKGDGRACSLGLYVSEDDFCSMGYRRESNG